MASTESVLAQLDALDRDSSLIAGRDSVAIELMESFAIDRHRLALLVDRYRGSKSEYILASLAFVLARRAADEQDVGTQTLYRMIQSLMSVDHPAILQCCLSAIQQKLMLLDTLPAWIASSEIADFVLHSVRYSGRDAWVVHGSAVELLLALGDKRLAPRIFSNPQLGELRRSLSDLLGIARGKIRPDIEAVIRTLST